MAKIRRQNPQGSIIVNEPYLGPEEREKKLTHTTDKTAFKLEHQYINENACHIIATWNIRCDAQLAPKGFDLILSLFNLLFSVNVKVIRMASVGLFLPHISVSATHSCHSWFRPFSSCFICNAAGEWSCILLTAYLVWPFIGSEMIEK